jgi:vanillin dehydrogenase
VTPVTDGAGHKESPTRDCAVSDEPRAPFGDVNNSGFGREGGRFSIEEMTELKWITIQSGQRAFPM